MKKKPNVIRLAEKLFTPDAGLLEKLSAAKELRRLDAVNQELLGALRVIASAENSALDLAYCKGIARAAIAKAEAA